MTPRLALCRVWRRSRVTFSARREAGGGCVRALPGWRYCKMVLHKHRSGGIDDMMADLASGAATKGVQGVSKAAATGTKFVGSAAATGLHAVEHAAGKANDAVENVTGIDIGGAAAAGVHAVENAAEKAVNVVEGATGIDIDRDGDIGVKGHHAKRQQTKAPVHLIRRRESASDLCMPTSMRELCERLAKYTVALLLTKASVCFLFTAVFVAIFAAIFEANEGPPDGTGIANGVDAVYYVIVTISTVGYGDFSPTKPGTRAVALIMIFSGTIFIFPLLSAGVAYLSDHVTKWGRDMLGRLFPLKHVDVDGDGQSDYAVPQHYAAYYFQNLLPSFALNLLVQLTFSLIFVAVSDVDFGTATYHCMVTATTVGYGDTGDVTASRGARLTVIFHIIFSVVLLAEMLNTVDSLRAERAAQLARVRQLERRLDAELYEQLIEHAKRLRPKVERDGLGLTELEFAITMLLQLEIVAWDQVQPFIKQFRKLNVTGDGRLGKNDLSVMQLASSKNLASLATHLGHRGSALTVAERSGAPSRQVTLRRSTSVPAGR